METITCVLSQDYREMSTDEECYIYDDNNIRIGTLYYDSEFNYWLIEFHSYLSDKEIKYLPSTIDDFISKWLSDFMYDHEYHAVITKNTLNQY